MVTRIQIKNLRGGERKEWEGEGMERERNEKEDDQVTWKMMNLAVHAADRKQRNVLARAKEC